jgi:hypothetical protein
VGRPRPSVAAGRSETRPPRSSATRRVALRVLWRFECVEQRTRTRGAFEVEVDRGRTFVSRCVWGREGARQHKGVAPRVPLEVNPLGPEFDAGVGATLELRALFGRRVAEVKPMHRDGRPSDGKRHAGCAAAPTRCPNRRRHRRDRCVGRGHHDRVVSRAGRAELPFEVHRPEQSPELRGVGGERARLRRRQTVTDDEPRRRHVHHRRDDSAVRPRRGLVRIRRGTRGQQQGDRHRTSPAHQ